MPLTEVPLIKANRKLVEKHTLFDWFGFGGSPLLFNEECHHGLSPW